MGTIILVLNFIKKYYQFILFILVIILSVMFFQTWSSLKNERKQREIEQRNHIQNISALTDSITASYDEKLKAYVFEKDNYIVKKLEDLEKYNKNFYDRLNKIEGKVIAAIDSKVTGDLGGITAGNQLCIIDSNTNNYGLKFISKYKDEGFEQELEGISKFYAYPDEINKKWMLKPDTTIFSKNITKLNITYGFREDDNKYEVFAISSSPRISINNLEGALILEKYPSILNKPSNKWGIGPYIGGGITSDAYLKDIKFGYSIGVSLHYNIFSW